ncbi:MAG TPA: hypothetical protein VLJ21_00290 [Candidatus Binatia bacterium]|nr:hypothetical protein [Candidatus Binatia bacterium]
MQDIGLVVIKPEGFSRREEISSELCERGYVILEKVIIPDWRRVIPAIYASDASWKHSPPEHLDELATIYAQRDFGNVAEAVVLKHKDGGTLEKIETDIGPWKAYLPGTLRHKFGIPQDPSSRWVFTALHKADTQEIIRKYLILFFDQALLERYA